MGVGLKIVVLLTFLSLMYIVGSLIFAKGFLLKRVVVEQNSSCRVDFARYGDGHGGDGCWLHKRFSKAIIVVIDALRFDFMVPMTKSEAGDKPYRNKLTSIHNLLSRKPQNSRLYKFIADPPTTTLQRLKGLTTGSLPTFVDAGSNFASSEITEDNFIDQLVKKGKKITLLGDDTWMGLFPGRFHREYPFPSFNVKDLHTLDNGVLAHLYDELKRGDWDLTIAHFLGVDHCGHRYGPNHPAMAEKLAQMDQVIRNVTSRMNDDTVLFVLGDHGMTATGDHGGDSHDELTAGLFVYSPEQITSTKYVQGEYKTVSQTDLVPTISLLLGLPIPFSNLGRIITDILNYCPWTRESHIKQVFHTVQALRLNALQMSSYLEAYAKLSSDFSQASYNRLQGILATAEQDLQNLVTVMSTQGESENVHQKFHALEKQYLYFIDEVRSMCQNVWAKFDLISIVLGLLTIAVSIGVNVYLVAMESAVARGQGLKSAVVVMFGSSVYLIYAIFQTFYLEGNTTSFMAFILGFVDLGAVLITMRIILTGNRKDGAVHTKKSRWKLSDISVEKMFSYFIICCSAVAFFSNSFVIYDDSVSAFLLQSMVWVISVRTIQAYLREKASVKEHPGKKFRSDGIFDIMRLLTNPVAMILMLAISCSCCIRLAANFRSCREEQVNCTITMFLHPLTSLGDTVEGSRNLRYFLSTACFFTVVYLSRSWLKHYGNINSLSLPTVCAKYLLPVTSVCCVAHWAMQGLPQKVLDSLPVIQQIILPQAVYMFLILSTVAMVAMPLLVYRLPEGKELNIPSSSQGDALIQRAYNYVKLNWREHFSNKSEEKNPVVFGLATVYSAGIVYLATVVLLLLTMLLGDGLAPSQLLAVLAMFFLLEIVTVHSKWSKDKAELLVPGAVIISLLSNSFFYSTGHQATIPSIRFEAAYTGFHGDFNNKVIPTILIYLNTFASEVLFTVVSPLLILWPYTKGIISLYIAQKKGAGVAPWKGDFALFEDKDLFRSLLLKLFSVLFLVNSLKLFGALCAAALHRRHLMVWKIFAPRFVFTAMSTFTVYGFSIMTLLFLLRIDSVLEPWVLKLDKK